MEKEAKKKDAKTEAEEMAKAMAQAYHAEMKELNKAEEEEEKKKVEKTVEKADMKIRVEAGINEDVTNDMVFQNGITMKTIEKFRSIQNGVIVEQKKEEDRKAKMMLFWRALYAHSLHRYDQNYHNIVKALSEGVDAEGGFLVTPEFKTEVLRQLHDNGIFRKHVRVVPTTVESVNFNAEDGLPKVTWGTENTTISTSSASLTQTTITVYRMNALMYLSRELVADSQPPALQWIQDEFVDAVLNEEDAVIAAGSGSGRPTGLTQLSINSVAQGGGFDYRDIKGVEHKLPIAYRKRGNPWFYMHDDVMRSVEQLQDSQNRPLFLRDLSGKKPDMLFGYPVEVSNNLPRTEMYFGDLKRTYILLDRQQMSVDTTTEGGSAWEKHQVGMKITERIGGNAVRTDALVKLTGIG